MAARLYSNENFHRLVVEALRELGHDVLTSLEAGRSNRRIPDDEVLQFATSEGAPSSHSTCCISSACMRFMPWENWTNLASSWLLDHTSAGEKFPGMHTPPIELPEEYVWCDPERLGGKPCFRGTRVPVDALFGNLEDGMSLDEFLEAFEGVTREQVVGVLEAARAATHGVPIV